LAAWILVAALPPVAAIGRWRAADVEAASAIPPSVTVVALLALVWIAARLVKRLSSVIGALCAGWRLERSLPSRAGLARLVVVEDDEPSAHAVAGLPGCSGHIIVTTGLLHGLDDRELRRAVVEHERAHLRHHHAAFQVLCELAVAVNPLLRSMAGRVAYALERWADEDAAEVTSRATVAEAVATVSLQRGFSAQAAPARLAFHEVGVGARVSALLEEPPDGRWQARFVEVAVAVLFVGAAAAGLHACHDTEVLFETLRRWRLLGR
jgi:Zn-dependent protease with chaperone function